MPSKKCPVCGVSVKVENLERHVKDRHPRADVRLDKLLTTTERERVKTAKARPRPAMTRRGKRIAMVAGVVTLLLVAVLILYPRSGLSPGQMAPDFDLPRSDTGRIHLSELISLYRRPVLLQFMDVDCEYCKQEAPALALLYGNYSGLVSFVSLDANIVGQEDTAQRINDYKLQYDADWPHCLYDQGVVNAYQIGGTPTIYILDSEGRVADLSGVEGNPIVGAKSYDVLKRSLDAVLA